MAHKLYRNYTFTCTADARTEFVEDGFVTVDQDHNSCEMHKLVHGKIKEVVFLDYAGFSQINVKHYLLGV